MTTPRCCRCQADTGLRLYQSYTIWNEQMPRPEQHNLYICIDQQACSERLNEAAHFKKEADLWANYNKLARPRRYTPRRYWKDGKRLTFAIAQALFQQAGMSLEKGRPDFPTGLKSGYIINQEWRYTSLLEAIELIQTQPKKQKPACQEVRF